MFARALIVLLLMLNLGVAAWWVSRPAAAPEVPTPAPAGVATLRLLAEAPATTRAASPAPAQPAPDGPERCIALGPYAGELAALASRTALLGWGASRVRVRPAPGAIRGWNVAVAGFADKGTADAIAARIRAAGFEDLLVMPAPEGGHGIALGRYGSEASARQRVASLRAAGFAAQARPIADPATRHWLDVALPGDRDVVEVRRVADAESMEELDCAATFDGPAAAPR